MDIDFFDIVTGVLKGNTLVPYIFIICQHYVLRTSIDVIKNYFILKNARSRRYLAENVTDADNGNDQVLLEITPAKAELRLHSLEKAAGGINLYMNANKTKLKCFKR